MKTGKSALETDGKTIPWAAFYDPLVRFFTLGKEKRFREAIIDVSNITSGQKLLEVGCGTGTICLAAKSRFGDVVKVFGIDASSAMIELARKKAEKSGLDISFETGLIENIEHGDNSFDRVFCVLMLHHLPDSLKEKGLKEVHRVLKPGGKAIAVDLEATQSGSWFQKMGDLIVLFHGGHRKMANNVKALVPFFQKSGFRVEKIEKLDRQFTCLVAEK